MANEIIINGESRKYSNIWRVSESVSIGEKLMWQYQRWRQSNPGVSMKEANGS
jgi:hypothetical protein